MIDVTAAMTAWNIIRTAAPWDRVPVWTHADLHAGNILVNKGNITAVIDFGMSGIGDPACDLMAAWTLLSATSRPLFRSQVAVDDATWQRGRGWALSFGLIALPYYKNTNQMLAHIARRTIHEVIEKL